MLKNIWLKIYSFFFVVEAKTEVFSFPHPPGSLTAEVMTEKEWESKAWDKKKESLLERNKTFMKQHDEAKKAQPAPSAPVVNNYYAPPAPSPNTTATDILLTSMLINSLNTPVREEPQVIVINTPEPERTPEPVYAAPETDYNSSSSSSSSSDYSSSYSSSDSSYSSDSSSSDSSSYSSSSD